MIWDISGVKVAEVSAVEELVVDDVGGPVGGRSPGKVIVVVVVMSVRDSVPVASRSNAAISGVVVGWGGCAWVVGGGIVEEVATESLLRCWRVGA